MKIGIKGFLNIFNKKEESKIDQVLFWMIWGIVLIIPLFFVSASSSAIELNKTLLFAILVMITTIMYFIKSFRTKNFVFHTSFMDWGILIFFAFNILSFIFSKNHYVSAVGLSGFYSGGFFATACFILFFYLIINIVKSWPALQKIIMAVQLSSIIIILFNIFQVNAIYMLPWSETQNYSFNLIANSSLNLAVFSSLIILISLVIFIISEIKWHKYLSLFCLVAALVLLFLLNKDLPIYILVGLIATFLVFISFKYKNVPNYWTVVATVVATILILFIIFDSMVLFNTQVSENILLDNSTSSTIAWQSLKKYPLWGSGQQTFVYDFSQFRPIEFNKQEYWNIQFLKSANEWWGLLTTLGLGAVISLWYIYFAYFHKLWQNLKNYKFFEKKELWKILVFFSWILIFLSSFFLPFNFILYFFNWLLLGLGVVVINLEDKNFKVCIVDLKKVNFKYWGIMVSLSFSIILFLVIIVLGGRIWLSDLYYASAQRSIVDNESEDIIFSQLDKAIKLDPYESKYYLSLAQGYSAKALIEVANQDANSPEIQSYTQSVVDNLKKAKQVDPYNSSIYEREASIYDSLRNIIGNVDELSVTAYLKAIELEPNDPILWLNLGRSRLLLAQSIFTNNDNEESKIEANNQLDLAIEDFEKVRTLRNDLAADYNIGLVYQTKGELDEALKYYYQELNSYPDSVNLRYQIALVYEQQGNIDLAIEQLKIVLELDPDNQSILEVIAELEGNSEADINSEPAE